jgi:hypothetical protein
VNCEAGFTFFSGLYAAAGALLSGRCPIETRQLHPLPPGRVDEICSAEFRSGPVMLVDYIIGQWRIKN